MNRSVWSRLSTTALANQQGELERPEDGPDTLTAERLQRAFFSSLLANR
jgi:hypothetical protein